MLVKVRISALRDTRWHEYALRFGLGGLATVGTGLIAQVFGPATGGCFSPSRRSSAPARH